MSWDAEHIEPVVSSWMRAVVELATTSWGGKIGRASCRERVYVLV